MRNRAQSAFDINTVIGSSDNCSTQKIIIFCLSRIELFKKIVKKIFLGYSVKSDVLSLRAIHEGISETRIFFPAQPQHVHGGIHIVLSQGPSEVISRKEIADLFYKHPGAGIRA